MLWHSMNVDKLNRVLQESVSMQDIQNSQTLNQNLDSFDLDAFLSVTLDFGKHRLDSKEHTVVFELLNNGDIPASWQLKTFSTHEEQLDAWVEPLTARNPDEEFRDFILKNNIFKWSMRSGQLPPKQRQTLVMSYTPSVEGTHYLSVCLDVIDGKKIKLNLQGSTSREWEPELILAPYSQLGTVPIGCTHPPVQQLTLHNRGTCTANYELHLEELLRLNEENDFEVFTLLGNEKGEVESEMSISLPVIFNPIEEKQYQVELPITVNGSRLDSITLKGKGAHPKHISKEQTTIEEFYAVMPDASCPVQSDEDRKDLMSGLIRVSTQILSFGVMQPKRIYRRLVEITNQSECLLVYEVDATNFASASQGQLRIAPDYGLLEPNANQDILFEYSPAEHPEIFASDIFISVTTNPSPPNEVTSEGTTDEEIFAIHPLPITGRRKNDPGGLAKRLPVHLSSTVSFRRRFEHLEMEHKDLSVQKASEDDDANNNIQPRTESLILQLVGEVQCGLSTSKNNIKQGNFTPQDVNSIVSDILFSILEEDNTQEILNHPQTMPSVSLPSPEAKTSESVDVFIDEIIRSLLSETT